MTCFKIRSEHLASVRLKHTVGVVPVHPLQHFESGRIDPPIITSCWFVVSCQFPDPTELAQVKNSRSAKNLSSLAEEFQA